MTKQPETRFHDRLLWALLIGVATAAAVWAGWSFFIQSQADGLQKRVNELDQPSIKELLQGTPVTHFAFTDQQGRTVTRETFKGKVWVLGFVFTRCTMSCPQITAGMVQLQKDLRQTDVILVALSVDPEHDTPETLRTYAAAFQADPERWLFLTGDKKAIYQFLEESFKPLGGQPKENPEEPAGRRIAHSNRLVLIDRQGKIYDTYLAVRPISEDAFEIHQPELDRLRQDAAKLAQETAP